MLSSISIRNFALIEQLYINFSPGFSVITGETGAGKSILLGALGLVLGKRADLTSLKDKDQKCVVEAVFDLSNFKLKSFFEENDIDYEDQTLIRREILPSGKSRAFVNDTPVNVSELQLLGGFLIDIHSQNQTQELGNEMYQIEILDAVAANELLLNSYQEYHKTYKKNLSLLKTYLATLAQSQKEQDYHLFLLNELEQAELSKINQTELEDELEQLNNIEFLKENIEKCIVIAREEQFGSINSIKEIKITLQKVSDTVSTFQNLSERTNSVLIELDDIISELVQHQENFVDNPERRDQINQTLQQLYTLQKKHQVNTIEELIEIENELQGKVSSTLDLENTIENLQKEIQKNQSELDKIAQQISDNRSREIPKLIIRLETILAELGMPNVRFKIDMKPSESFLENGKDIIQILFSANKGSDFGLLKKIASGGEMSRIMLAVKSILATYNQLPTIIFDEIDTGVSGEIANKMAIIMQELSTNIQVLSITHLPQIASKGQTHYKVFKQTVSENTTSEIIKLNQEERIREIAEMLSGKDLTDSAINHAKALLN